MDDVDAEDVKRVGQNWINQHSTKNHDETKHTGIFNNRIHVGV